MIPKEVIERLFQVIPEGDQEKTHITLVVFLKGNGRYKDERAAIEGAPLPMVIHTKTLSISKEKETTAIENYI